MVPFRAMGGAEVTLVTGASSGIGAAIATRLARGGAAVLAGGRDEERCRAVCAAIEGEGGVAWPLPFDVTDFEQVRAAVDRGRELAIPIGPISWLVNSAGMVDSAPLLPRGRAAGDELLAHFEAHMAVNLHGPRRLMEALLPGMIERGRGRILNVVSSAGLRGYAYTSAYAASKHALLGYTRAAIEELRGTGVLLNAICPHFVDTPLLAASAARLAGRTGRSSEEILGDYAALNPGGRLVTAAEVAEAAWELLAGERRGVVLEIDGRGTWEVKA